MPAPRSPEVRRFHRVALLRFAEAQFLLHPGQFPNSAVYLGGYAVECILKALMLAHEPTSRHAATVASFRGNRGHELTWLTGELIRRRFVLPKAILGELKRVRWWSTEMRYLPQKVPLQRASQFLQAVKAVLDWAQSSM